MSLLVSVTRLYVSLQHIFTPHVFTTHVSICAWQLEAGAYSQFCCCIGCRQAAQKKEQSLFAAVHELTAS